MLEHPRSGFPITGPIDPTTTQFNVKTPPESAINGRQESHAWAIVSGTEIGEVRFPLMRALEFGCQAAIEQTYPDLHFGMNSNLAIIAALSFRILSRRHLVITLLTSGHQPDDKGRYVDQ